MGKPQTYSLELNIYQLESLHLACLRQVGTLNEVLAGTAAVLQAAKAPPQPVPTPEASAAPAAPESNTDAPAPAPVA